MPDCTHFGLVDCMKKLNKIRLDFSFQCSGGLFLSARLYTYLEFTD